MRLSLWVKIALVTIFFLLVGVWMAPYFRGESHLNPILFSLGGLDVHWYGALMAAAILICVTWILNLNRIDSRFTEDDIVSAATWAAVGGFIGARLLYVLLKWGDYAANPLEIVMVQHGGLSIHGALLGGIITLFVYTRLTKKPFWPLTDIFAVALPLGQLIGQFGNFFNQEAAGFPTTLPWKMFIDEANRPAGFESFQYFHPTFLYEALGSLVVWVVLLRLYRRAHLPGQITALYLILYSGLRFIVEFWRIDSDYWGEISIAQWASLAIIALVGTVWYLKFKKR